MTQKGVFVFTSVSIAAFIARAEGPPIPSEAPLTIAAADHIRRAEDSIARARKTYTDAVLNIRKAELENLNDDARDVQVRAPAIAKRIGAEAQKVQAEIAAFSPARAAAKPRDRVAGHRFWFITIPGYVRNLEFRADGTINPGAGNETRWSVNDTGIMIIGNESGKSGELHYDESDGFWKGAYVSTPSALMLTPAPDAPLAR